MGIELQQHQIRVALSHSRHSAAADGVLAAQHQGFEPKIQNGCGGLLHGLHHRFGSAK